MNMQGEKLLPVSPQQAWEALNDPQVLKSCIMGCEKIEAVGDNQFALGLGLRIGPVSAKFAGNIQLSNVQPPQSYTLHFEGQGGVAGFGKGVSNVVLIPQGNDTLLKYDVSAEVGGKIAQVGQRLIDGVARNMAEDFFGKFEHQLRERYGIASVTGASAAESSESPHSPVDSAARVSPAVSDQAVDPSRQPTDSRKGIPSWVIALLAFIVIGLIALSMR